MVKRIAYFWFLLTVAGLAIYLALFAAELLDSPLVAWYRPSNGMWAVALGTLTIAILLALDEKKPQAEHDVEKMTFAGLLYVLLFKRTPLLAILVLCLVAVGLGVYYFSRSIGVTFETEGDTLSIKLPGQTVYYFPITSQQGWQNTGILLKEGQRFRYWITGSVSPGYLQDIDELSARLREFKTKGQPYPTPELEWPFTGPEGYVASWYADRAAEDEKRCGQEKDEKAKEGCGAITKHYDQDTGLTVQGVAHNRVVGIIQQIGTKPESANRNGKEPGYNYREDNKKKLILFEPLSAPVALRTPRANADGELWVVINDADAYRWDNAGLFFLKIVVF